MAILKSDIVNAAYSRMRVSGITTAASSSDTALALDVLEGLMHELFDRTICLGYNFQDTPDLTDPSGVSYKYKYAVSCILAMRILSDFGKGAQDKVDPVLMKNANAAMSYLYSSTATPRETQYPARQPIGSGNSLRYNRFRQFYRPVPEAPNTCETNKMIIGEIENFTEYFGDEIISPETISSYVLTADSGLTVSSESLSSPTVSYTVEAEGSDGADYDTSLQIKIVATSSIGRVIIRIINFELSEE